jgi:hypothetical protein
MDRVREWIHLPYMLCVTCMRQAFCVFDQKDTKKTHAFFFFFFDKKFNGGGWVFLP